MLAPITITLLVSAVTVPLALGLLILLMWHDAARITNRYFSWFLLTVCIWLSGSILSRAAAIANVGEDYIELGLLMLEFGFTNAALALLLYVITLTGNRSRFFHLASLLSISGLSLYYVVLIQFGTRPDFVILEQRLIDFQFPLPTRVVFGAINAVTIAVVWQGFRRLQRPALAFGTILFCLGQFVVLFSPRLRQLSVAEDTGAIAVLIMSGALVQTQIIQPLTGQSRQIEAVRDVGLAITSRLLLQSVLETIAAQAAVLLKSDASIIYLTRPTNDLVLAAQYNIHYDILGYCLPVGDGLAGQVVIGRKPQLLTDYRHQWRGMPDAPYAKDGFGSVIAVPLIFADEVVGVLFVVNGAASRLFDREDVQLLELLAPQAAVAITNSRLFEQERALTNELELAKTRLEAFLQSTDNPVIATNRQLDIIFANEAAAKLVDGINDIRGRSLREIVPVHYLPSNLRHLLIHLRQDSSYVYELEIDGRIYLSHVARIDHPERGWIAVLNEVTSLKELDRLQRQMIELTTHQLKNPLQGAMLHLDELEDLGQGILTEDMRYDLSVVWEQMERMRRLIESILNLERLQNRSTSRSEIVDFIQVVRGAVEALAPQAQKKQIALRTNFSSPSTTLRGDFGELMEVVNNLVDNAIKYTPSQGEVQVKVSASDGHAILEVCDTGIGIPPDVQNRVFDRFYRVEQSGTEQIGGTGMGLSLVKAIIEAHGGRVWLESRLGAGTIFYVRLPTAQGDIQENLKV